VAASAFICEDLVARK